MSGPLRLARADVVGILAALGRRSPGAVREEVGSLELTWLITELEQRHGVVLDLSEEALAGIRTVDDALKVLGGVLTAAPQPGAGR